MKKRMVNVGSGGDYRLSTPEIEWINVEKNPKLKADIHADLEDASLPIEKSSCDYILMKHVAEHIMNFIPLMDELYRILKPDGVLEIHTPYWTNKWAWGDPTHVRAFFEGSFVFWDKEDVAKQVAEGRPTSQLNCKANFKTLEIMPMLEAGVKERFKTDEEFGFALRHYNNIIAELRIKLKAIK